MCSRLDSYLARSQQCLRLPVARTCKAMKYRIAIIGGGCLSARLSREEARCFVRAAAPTGDKERLSCYVWADASKVPQAFPYPGSSSRTFPLEMILTEFSGGFTALQKAAEEHLGSGKREAKKACQNVVLLWSILLLLLQCCKVNTAASRSSSPGTPRRLGCSLHVMIAWLDQKST